MLRAKIRLYLDATGKRIVEAGAESVRLFKAAGEVIQEQELQLYEGIEEFVHDPDETPRRKRISPRENKMIAPDEDKAVAPDDMAGVDPAQEGTSG